MNFLARGELLAPMHTMNSTPLKLPTSWTFIPYFSFYFLIYTLNTLLWPLMLVEHSCMLKFSNETYQPKESCLKSHFNGSSIQSMQLIDSNTLNTMILAAVVSAILSLASYFLIWKPTLSKCSTISVLIPPICLLTQNFLQMYALKYILDPVFKIIIVAAVCVPSIHANFQGVLLLFHQLKAPNEKINFKQRQEYANTKLEITHCALLISSVFVGFLVSTAFDISYNLIFMLESLFACLACVYGILMLPNKCKCDINSDDDEEEINDGDCSDDDLGSLSSEEEEQLMKMAKFKQDNGLLSNQSNLFSEAPMIFSESSYKKELVIVIEITIFTIAIIADSAISGPYLIQAPFSLTLREYGYCISIQGISKIIGFLIIKTCIYFNGIKHGTLVLLSAFNYVIYYIVLGIAKTKVMIFIAMVTNVFGGIALPTISSFIILNFNETSSLVLEMATVSSLIATVAFSSVEYFVYVKTVNLVPGAIFLLTAAIIVVGFIVTLGTYFTTTTRNKRRTKNFTDTLLNDYE